jgi:hypothetical protein
MLLSCFGGFEGLVPFAVEFGSVESAVGSEGVHFGLTDFHAGQIDTVIEFGVNFQPVDGGGSAYEVDDDLMADQGPAAPVHGDVVEQLVFDLIRK